MSFCPFLFQETKGKHRRKQGHAKRGKAMDPKGKTRKNMDIGETSRTLWIFSFFDFVSIISSFLDHFFHFLGSIFSLLFLKEEKVEKRMGNRGKRNKDTRKFREPLRFSVFLHLPCFSIFYSFVFAFFFLSILSSPLWPPFCMVFAFIVPFSCLLIVFFDGDSLFSLPFFSPDSCLQIIWICFGCCFSMLLF